MRLDIEEREREKTPLKEMRVCFSFVHREEEEEDMSRLTTTIRVIQRSTNLERVRF